MSLLHHMSGCHSATEGVRVERWKLLALATCNLLHSLPSPEFLFFSFFCWGQRPTDEHNHQPVLKTQTFQPPAVTARQIIRLANSCHSMSLSIDVSCHCCHFCVRREQLEIRFTQNCSWPLRRTPFTMLCFCRGSFAFLCRKVQKAELAFK